MASFLEVALKVAGTYVPASLVIVALLLRYSLGRLVYWFGSIVALRVEVDVALSRSGLGGLISSLLMSLGAIGVGLLADLTLLSCLAFHGRLVSGDSEALPAWMSIAPGFIIVGGDDDPGNLKG